MDYQQRHSSDGVREPTTYGDWLAVDAAIPQFAPVPSDLVGTAYFAHTCTIMEQVAQVLGKAADARRFALLAQEVRQAFRLEFLTENGRLVGDCQSAYLLALAFDLLGEAQRPAAVERLVELIRVRGWRLSTGFIGTPLLCPVLSRFGRHDVAVRLLLQDQWPSWLFTVKNGATTMWERWDSYTPERGFGDVSMNSFNHYAYGAVGEWMVHWLAGLAPGHEAPAYRHIVFRPQPSERISSASARLDTPYGVASISWQTGSGEISGEVAVPSGAFADFIAAFNDLEMIRDGVPVSLPVVESAQGIATQVRLLAGTYRFKGALCCAEGERACALSL